MSDMRLIDAKFAEKLIRERSQLLKPEHPMVADIFLGICDFLDACPTVDAVLVVRCKDCVTHGNCLTEDTFNLCRIENPFCCSGKRKAGDPDA